MQSLLDNGGLGKVEQSLPAMHKKFQVENHALEKAGKEQNVRTYLQ